MSKPAARVGDMHTCPMSDGPKPHVGGPILPPGVPMVLIGGMPAATITNQCVCVSPAPDVIVMGAVMVLIGGKPAARMGDSTAHGGVIVAGCPTVLIGDMGTVVAGGGAVPKVAKGDAKEKVISPDPKNEAERKKMAEDFYKDLGWSDEKVASHIKGIDFSQPVEIVELPKDTALSQWQHPESTWVGNYFAKKGTDPSTLGINPEAANKFKVGEGIPKIESDFVASDSVVALKSTASNAVDTWSMNIQGPEVPNSFVLVGEEHQTKGGGTQYFVPDKNKFE